MLRLLVGALALSASAIPAQAQTGDGLKLEVKAAADHLGQCMVLKSSGEDRIVIARWMVLALASAPQLNDVMVVDQTKKVAADRAMAGLFTRLITSDCKPEAKALFATKDANAFELAGGPLGRIAMRELLSNEKAMGALAAYADYLKDSDFAEVRQ